MKQIFKFIAVFATTAFLFPSALLAYVPPSDFLLNKAIKTHGKGIFSIEQEVIFRSESELQTVKETWLIVNGDSMKLTVSSGTLSLNFIYQDGKVYFCDHPGNVVSRRISSENLERFFHARSDKALSDFLVAAKVVSVNPLRQRPKPHDLKLLKNESDPYVRFSKIADSPTFLISSTTDPKLSFQSPGIWLDEESYTIRKIRFPSQAEIMASDYQSLSNDLVAPKTRIVSWNQSAVEIRLLKARSLTRAQEGEVQMSPQALSQASNEWGSSSLISVIKDFYQRFR